MAATAQLRSASAVLNWYNDQPQAAFKLYRFSVMPKNITGAYDGKSKDEGYEKLQSELALIANDDYNNFVLGLFNEKDKEKATPAINKVFTVNDAPLGMVAGYGVSNHQAQINNEILNEIRAMRAERLAEIEEDETEEEEEEQPMTPGSILAGMLQQPRVQEMLINALSSMAGNFARPRVQPQPDFPAPGSPCFANPKPAAGGQQSDGDDAKEAGPLAPWSARTSAGLSLGRNPAIAAAAARPLAWTALPASAV